MKKLIFGIVLAALPLTFVFADDSYPNIALIQTDADNQMVMGVTEKAAAQIFYQTHPDIYDFLIFYHTFTPQLNMQQGLLIQYTITGIGREGYNPTGPASAWGSGGKLMGGARMCLIDQYPDNPDDNMKFPLAGLTSVELLAHEMSHYWFAAMDFKKEGAAENNGGLRGCEGASDGKPCSPNQHWNHYFNSGPSVMYGSDITDNNDGTFTLTPSKPRKYGPFDQYIMGLIPPEEVGELFFLCGSSDPEQCKEGSPSLPTPHTAAPDTISGQNKIIVSMDDVIRAMGSRTPVASESKKHFNVGFIMVSKPGFIPFPQQLEKLEKIRVRFQEWFTWATDGRATICTELDGDCEGTEIPDDDNEIISDEDTIVVEDNTVIPDETTTDESQVDENVTTDENQVEDKDSTVVADNNETPDDVINPIPEDDAGCGCTIIF